MSLNRRIVLILLAVVGLYTIATYGIQLLVVGPTFTELERDEARKDLDRCVEAVRSEIHHLETLCTDWALWDDTCAYVQDTNPGFASSNLVDESFTDVSLNLIFICDPEWRVVWGKTFDLEEEEYISLAEFPDDALRATSPLLKFEDEDTRISGLVLTERGPMLVASVPILNSQGEGPIRGAVIMGRFLDDARVQALVERTRVALEVWLTDADSRPDGVRRAQGAITEANPVVIQTQGSDRLHTLTTFPDLAGDPVLVLRADIPRDITSRGSSALQFAFVSLLASSLFLLIVLHLLLRHNVTRPLTDLTRHAIQIARDDDLTARIASSRHDEIGTLAAEFDAMVEQVADTRRQLLDRSYESGKSEMAAGILHNTRNALGPIIARLDALRQQCSRTSAERIEIAEAELAAEGCSEDRRRDLEQFLDLSRKKAVQMLQQGRPLLDDVWSRATDIEKILSHHGSHRDQARALETCRPAGLIADALATVPDEFRERVDFRVADGVDALVPIRCDRIALLQVIANLLINAAESTCRTESQRGEVLIEAVRRPADDGEVLEIRVRDHGAGIEPDDLKRIFARGYSTKPEGGTGLGLHWSATTASNLGGRLVAGSRGSGQGACLKLTLPIPAATSGISTPVASEATA